MFSAVNFFLLLLVAIPSNCSNLNSEKSASKIVGVGCQLTEPVYDYMFDFTPLHSEFGHKVSNEKGDLFEFNVCGKLSKNCGENSNVAACLTRNNKSYILGHSHELIYNNGKTYFSFTDGEKCVDGKNYTLNVMIMCDYTMDVQPFSITPTADSECSFYINWETNYACLPLPDNMRSNLCTAKDQETGHIFDLMPLSDSNHRSINRNGSFFIINVCKPVLYGQNSMCPANSSVCYVDSESHDIKHKYLNYGIAQPAPILQNGQLIMRFSSLVKCNDNEYIKSTIYFNCDPAVKFGSPDFMGRRGCHYQFTWQTSLACNAVQPCVAHNPMSGKQYDFNSIAGIYTAQHNTKLYTIGICKQAGSPCHADDGVCEKSDGKVTSLGNYTMEVIFNDTWAPYLHYKSGDICNVQNAKWSTKIEFVCAINGTTLGPKVIENTNCQVLIHFVTKFACKEQTLCKVESSESNDNIDLTPLIGSTENYIATVNESLKLNNSGSLKFFLNVCRPLVQQFGLSCPAGSAACKAEMVSSSSTPEQEQSLGYPDVSLTLIDRTTAQLLYVRGEVCPADASVKMSSRIEFICDIAAGKGNPILQSISDGCHYQFYWATNVMCSSHQCKFNASTCDIINDETHKSFNMRTAKFTNAGNITVNAKPSPFNINVCGSNLIAVTDYSHSTIKVFFDTIGPCGIDGSISVELRLVCRGIARRSSLSDDKACSLVFTQETPEICSFLGLIVPSADSVPVIPTTEIETPSTDKPPNSDDTKGKMISAAVTVITIAMIAIIVVSIVCLRNPVKRMAVKNFFRRNTHSVLYRRVDTVEEANLLLPQVDHFTDSDDDLLL